MKILEGENIVIEESPSSSGDFYISTTAKDDYTQLGNKPTINGFTLEGALYSENLGIVDLWDLIASNDSEDLVSSYTINLDTNNQTFSASKFIIFQYGDITSSSNSLSNLHLYINDTTSGHYFNIPISLTSGARFSAKCTYSEIGTNKLWSFSTTNRVNSVDTSSHSLPTLSTTAPGDNNPCSSIIIKSDSEDTFAFKYRIYAVPYTTSSAISFDDEEF